MTACHHGYCTKPATVTIRDSRTYCPRHADRLPSYVRHPAARKSGTPTRQAAHPAADRADPYRPATP